jgi:hypothetical protein
MVVEIRGGNVGGVTVSVTTDAYFSMGTPGAISKWTLSIGNF